MADDGAEDNLAEGQAFLRSRYFGKYRGLVARVDDPEKMGRITATVPDVYGPDLESPWAMPSVPFAGAKHGLALLPEKNDGVWIEFEAGDPQRPIWSGCWWSKSELPPAATATARLLATSAGHQVLIDEDNDELKLVHPSGAEICLAKDKITLKVGSQQIEISKSGVSVNNGALEVK